MYIVYYSPELIGYLTLNDYYYYYLGKGSDTILGSHDKMILYL